MTEKERIAVAENEIQHIKKAFDDFSNEMRKMLKKHQGEMEEKVLDVVKKNTERINKIELLASRRSDGLYELRDLLTPIKFALEDKDFKQILPNMIRTTIFVNRLIEYRRYISLFLFLFFAFISSIYIKELRELLWLNLFNNLLGL